MKRRHKAGPGLGQNRRGGDGGKRQRIDEKVRQPGGAPEGSEGGDMNGGSRRFVYKHVNDLSVGEGVVAVEVVADLAALDVDEL